MITEATQRLVFGLFVLEERGAESLKGIERPVKLTGWPVAGVVTRATKDGCYHPRDDHQLPVYGRALELTLPRDPYGSPCCSLDANPAANLRRKMAALFDCLGPQDRHCADR
jgi:hypothetical protein